MEYGGLPRLGHGVENGHMLSPYEEGSYDPHPSQKYYHLYDYANAVDPYVKVEDNWPGRSPGMEQFSSSPKILDDRVGQTG